MKIDIVEEKPFSGLPGDYTPLSYWLVVHLEDVPPTEDASVCFQFFRGPPASKCWSCSSSKSLSYDDVIRTYAWLILLRCIAGLNFETLTESEYSRSHDNLRKCLIKNTSTQLHWWNQLRWHRQWSLSLLIDWNSRHHSKLKVDNCPSTADSGINDNPLKRLCGGVEQWQADPSNPNDGFRIGSLINQTVYITSLSAAVRETIGFIP